MKTALQPKDNPGVTIMRWAKNKWIKSTHLTPSQAKQFFKNKMVCGHIDDLVKGNKKRS